MNSHIQEMNDLLQQCKKDLQSLKEMKKKLKEIQKNMNQLEAYYHSQYLTDVDAIENNEITLEVLNQDSIWNVMVEQHEQEMKLLKLIAKNL